MNIISKLIITLFLLNAFFIQESHSNSTNTDDLPNPKAENIFDSSKWKIKLGKDFPHRDKMLNDVLYTNKIRKLRKDEILNKLGDPSYYRDDKNYLHYIISQTRLLSWPLHTKVLVIKLKDDDSVDWIKIHK